MRFVKTFEEQLSSSEQIRIKDHIFNFIKSVLESECGFEVITKQSFKVEEGGVASVPKYYCDFIVEEPHPFEIKNNYNTVCGASIGFFIEQKNIGMDYFAIKYQPTTESKYDHLKSMFNFMKVHRLPMGTQQTYIFSWDKGENVTDICCDYKHLERVLKDISLKEYKKYNNIKKFDL